MKLADTDEAAVTALSLMQGFAAPWCVAGGWAIDLFLGRTTRPHSDLELAVFRQDQSRLRAHFAGWTFTLSVNGRRDAWQDGTALELPIHEIHAYSGDQPRQSIEFLLNERNGAHWVFRRDPQITLPLDRAFITSSFGVPVLSPEIVLLFKAKVPREKDKADFDATCIAMDRSRVRWLRSALLTCHPRHPWIAEIDAAAP